MAETKKPNAKSTMFLTFTKTIDGRITKCETIIIDLIKFSIENLKDKTQLVIYIPSKMIKKDYNEWALTFTISDDPCMMNAMDWTNLGHSRIRILLGRIKVLKKKYLTIIGVNFSIQLLQPERRFPNANTETKFSFW